MDVFQELRDLTRGERVVFQGLYLLVLVLYVHWRGGIETQVVDKGEY